MHCIALDIVRHFTRRKRAVYLDHNATTPTSKKVNWVMNRSLKNYFGNPSSVYRAARQSAEQIEMARQEVANAIHAKPTEIVFTGCATESNNTILKSLSDCFFPGKSKIVSSPVEHPSIIETLKYLEKKGILVEYCPVDHYGRVDPLEAEKLIDDNTFLVCCMLANNELGTIQDIAALSAIAKKHGALMMSDCVQALGKIPIDVESLGLDYASFSAHKLYGPKGVGALYIKEGSPFKPWMMGGHQEEGRRAGTESIHNILGFGAACSEIGNLLLREPKISRLTKNLLGELHRSFPECLVLTPAEGSLTNTVSIRFPGISNTSLMALLSYHGIAVSGGSACSMPENKASHVLLATGLSEQEARETLRISFGKGNSPADVRYTLKIFHSFLKKGMPVVDLISSELLDEQLLFDPQTFILDIRTPSQRKRYPGLPNSVEASYFALDHQLEKLPMNKNILVVCQRGNLSYLSAFHLKSKGFRHVSSLSTGIEEWISMHPGVYQKYAGKNIRQL